jgi:hypothetical protein
MSEVQHTGKEGAKLLTPEQQAMWRMEHRDELRGKTKEEKRAFRQKLRKALAAMPEAERTTLRSKLQAKWDALSADEKQKHEQKIKERQARNKKAKGGEDDEDE